MTKMRTVLGVLILGILASTAAHAHTTAGDVTDRDSLQAFVEGAKEYFEGITDVNEGAKLREVLRLEGDWKSGGTFLVIFLKNGYPFIHGNDREAESKNLMAVEDERGLKVVAELLAAAAAGGGFVEYHVDGPKTAYAVEYTSGITGRPFVLVGGYVQDVSHVPITYADLPEPAVTAFILGLDGDDERVFGSQIQFIQDAGNPMALVGMLTALKGTDLYHRMQAEGRLLDVPAGTSTTTLNFVPQMDPGKLIEGYLRVNSAVYDPPSRTTSSAA